MSRGKFLSLEEARQSGQFKRFCKEHPSEADRERTAAAARVSSRKHGMTNSPEWRSWCAMRNRCLNPKAVDFYLYGARGIKICVRWGRFENFIADMDQRPLSTHSLDRIDPEGMYEPSNCRWATRLEQANNRRDNWMVVIDGDEMTLRNALRAHGCVISVTQAQKRIKKGWPHKTAVSTPPMR